MCQCLFNAYRTCSNTPPFIPDIDNLCFLFVLDQSYWMFINFIIFSKKPMFGFADFLYLTFFFYFVPFCSYFYFLLFWGTLIHPAFSFLRLKFRYFNLSSFLIHTCKAINLLLCTILNASHTFIYHFRYNLGEKCF